MRSFLNHVMWWKQTKLKNTCNVQGKVGKVLRGHMPNQLGAHIHMVAGQRHQHGSHSRTHTTYQWGSTVREQLLCFCISGSSNLPLLLSSQPLRGAKLQRSRKQAVVSSVSPMVVA